MNFPALFTPSEGGSQSSCHGRVVLHPTREGYACFQGLLIWERKNTEEIHFPAVVVHHLETLRLAPRLRVHQQIWRQQGFIGWMFRQVAVRLVSRKGAIGDWEVIDNGCCALVGPGESESTGVETSGETQESPLIGVWFWANLEVYFWSRRWC